MSEAYIVSEKAISEFRLSGATILRKFWSAAEMLQVETAIDEVGKRPGPMIDVFETDSDGRPLFYNDFNNWRRLSQLKQICLADKVGEAFKALTGSNDAYFFHDHVICKKAGATKATPWHLDKTYFMLDGPHTASFWTPTVPLKASESLKFAEGSHSKRMMLMARGFDSNTALESEASFQDFSDRDIESGFKAISWDMELGDVLVFDFYTVHCAPAVKFDKDRKALSLRLVGDGTTFDARVENPAPPFTKMGYKSLHGDPLDERWFPKYNVTNHE